MRIIKMMNSNDVSDILCVKNVRIQNYSGPHFRAFGLNTEISGESLFSPNEGKYMRDIIFFFGWQSSFIEKICCCDD